MELRNHPEHRRGQPTAGGVGADLPHVDSQDRAASVLDAVDDFALHGQRPDEPVEVGDDQHVRLAGLDELDSATQAGTAFEGCAAGHVELLDRVNELEAVAVAGLFDAATLVARAHEPLALTVADATHAHDADGEPNGGALG
jgi:hypothetical protein